MSVEDSVEQLRLTKEQLLIESIKDWTGSPFIGDDCAALPDGHLITVDALVEGTHFLRERISAFELGWKTVAVNLSDVAAMAGRPQYLVVSATLPADISREFFADLYQAMVECANLYKAIIVGGDLTRGPAIVLSVTVLANVHENGCLLRSGAKPGDAVVVTGDFGASRAGLWLITEGAGYEAGYAGQYSHCIRAHLKPKPRLCESWSMVRRTGSRGALIDASDGLADALAQIARASKVGLAIDLEKLPIHKETKSVASLAGCDPIDWALYGGEDYELVGCIPDDIWQIWSDDNPFTKIGTVTDRPQVELWKGANKLPSLDLSRCFEQIRFCKQGEIG